jgi:dye decolorizing peroxidase
VTESQDRAVSGGLSRRSLLGLLGAGAAGAAVGVGGTIAVQAATSQPDPDTVGAAVVPFYGEHQAGLATPAQARAEFVALDLADGVGLAQVRALMQRWTSLAAALAAGQVHPDDPVPQLAEHPSSLTLTVGFGPRLFDAIGRPDQRPAGVAVYPPFAKDALEARFSEGDLLVQSCSDDALAAGHAADAMIAAAAGTATLRWRQSGFQRSAGVAEGQTARNLMGQKDGTANDPPDSDRFAATVWASGIEHPDWYLGGTTLVLRRIRMDLQRWSYADTRTRERVIGRHLDTGAPLGETDEFAPVPLTAQDETGQLVIPSSSHVRISHPDSNSGARMVRRGYNYSEGGESGLLFVALQADATRGFIPVMSRMAVGDDLNRFVTHTGSAVFAIPPGVPEGGYWGQGLLA